MMAYTVDELLIEIEVDIAKAEAEYNALIMNDGIYADYSHRVRCLTSRHKRLQSARNTILQYREERDERITSGHNPTHIDVQSR